MKITSLTVAQPERRTDQPYLARFDLSVNDDVELSGLMLRGRKDGGFYIATPRLGTGNFASLSASYREAIMQIVVPMYEVMQSNDTPTGVLTAD